jgi:hypothetical protein
MTRLGVFSKCTVAEIFKFHLKIKPLRKSIEGSRSGAMKHRIAIWAALGFFIACCWVLYTFVASPEYLHTSLRDPMVQAFAYISCPVIYAGLHFPIHFWWVPVINAGTYGMAGLMIELLRRFRNPNLAI